MELHGKLLSHHYSRTVGPTSSTWFSMKPMQFPMSTKYKYISWLLISKDTIVISDKWKVAKQNMGIGVCLPTSRFPSWGARSWKNDSTNHDLSRGSRMWWGVHRCFLRLRVLKLARKKHKHLNDDRWYSSHRSTPISPKGHYCFGCSNLFKLQMDLIFVGHGRLVSFVWFQFLRLVSIPVTQP